MHRFVTTLALVTVLAAAGCAGQPPNGPSTPADLSRIAGWQGAAVNSPHAFRFVVMSDRTGGHQPGAWARAVAEVNRLKPDFVMCVGDLIEGYCEQEAEAVEMWEEFDALTRKLDAPFFYCAGNHDIEVPTCRKVYGRRPGTAGKPYYSFDYRGCHFVVLDSSAIVNSLPKVMDAQWAWLAKDLAAAKGARHVFIFNHHPFYGLPAWTRLRKMLDPSRTTIFTGHRHTLSYGLEDEVPYFVLGRTAARAPDAEREQGTFQMFAHVTVSKGKPSVAILPVGEVLPATFISRALPKRLAAIGRGITLSSITAAGGQAALELSNPTDVPASYSLSWKGQKAWFAGGMPKAETLTVRAGKSARRSYRIRAPGPDSAPPTLEVAWKISYEGRPGSRTRQLPLLVLPALTARPVRNVSIDGKLGDWAGVPAQSTGVRWRVRDNPQLWSGPDDCSMTTRIGYDDKTVYLAIDVTDDAFVTEASQTWLRDGVEVFWDPRPAGSRGGRFADPCRQLMIPLPPQGQALTMKVNPPGAEALTKVRAACVRRAGGYTMELAIPAAAVAKGFKASPGAKLHMEVFANDNDGEPGLVGTSCMVLSGNSDASRNTAGYATVTFK